MSSPDAAPFPASGTDRAGADRAACRAAIRTGSRSFHAAGLLLPAAVRAPAHGLYAFCRLSDDAVDGEPCAERRARAVASLAARLDAAAAGRPADDPADRALAAILRAHAVPVALPRALIEGLAWDAEGRRYADLSALTAYAARVAGAVGAMMALVMGVRGADALARACDLGVAMQFTNIARDVGEDARAGRLYLPLDWLAEAGIDADAFLRDPRPSPALAGVVARLLAEADRLYARARPGIRRLPPRCRPAIRAASLVYAAIGDRVAAAGHDSVTARARVGASAKAALIARAALPDLAAAPVGGSPPPLPETAFLVDAVLAQTGLAHAGLSQAGAMQAGPREARPAPRGLPAWWDVPGKVIHVLDLIETLRERESLARGVS